MLGANGHDGTTYPFTCYPHQYAHHLKSHDCDLNDNCICQVEVCNRHHIPKTANRNLMAGRDPDLFPQWEAWTPCIPVQHPSNPWMSEGTYCSHILDRCRTTAPATPTPVSPTLHQPVEKNRTRAAAELGGDVSCGLEPSDDEPGVGRTMRGLSSARSLKDTTSLSGHAFSSYA